MKILVRAGVVLGTLGLIGWGAYLIHPGAALLALGAVVWLELRSNWSK